MSWTNELYQVYENNSGNTSEKTILLPVSHSTANAQIEITIDTDGVFVDAIRLADKKDSVTIIPVTEDSGTRSSGIAAHPLDDKLIYIAGDYAKFVIGKKANNDNHYQAYLEQLKQWINSEYSHPAVEAIYRYVSQGQLMQNLIEQKVLILDDSGKLKEKEKILGIDQADCFVRFRIIYKDDVMHENCVWKDKSLYESFINYNSSMSGERQLCYATGELLPCTYKHPSKIRNAGDKAKLISSNDESGFSYRGRFTSKEQALSVSYDFSQKMHNALKWLIEKQGIAIGSMTLVMWESNLKALPSVLNDPLSIFDDEDEWEDSLPDEEISVLNSDTVGAYRIKLKRAIWGTNGSFETGSKAMIMLLDAATTGRLSMNMYEEMETSEMYNNVEKWHTGISWNRFNFKNKKREIRSFSLYDIVDCTYGVEQGDFINCKSEIRNDGLLKLIPCVILGNKIPIDIVRGVVQKASKPTAYSKVYNWQKVLEVACGIVRKHLDENERNKKEVTGLALNKDCTNRDYLFGRLLAIAEAVEATALRNTDSNGRVTNAHRYFEVFSNRPYKTWGMLYNRLIPYLNRLKGGQRFYYEKLISEVMDSFEQNDFCKDTKLNPEFLLAYHCQLSEIYSKKDSMKEEE